MCKRITLFAIIALALLIQPATLLSSPSPDFNGDGVVDTADFLLFVQHFGTTEERYDLNADGTVDAADFLIFVEHFGKDAPPSGSGSDGGGSDGGSGGSGSDGGVSVIGMTRLTKDKGQWVDPLWSPDGRFILFEEHHGALYRMDSDGSNRIRLTESWWNLSAAHTAWSPDSRFIAFASTHNGNQYDIYRMDSDGSNLIQLTLKPEYDEHPSWSPDGRFIFFFSKRQHAGIYRMDPDGSNITFVGNGGFPIPSPDGRFIAFQTSDGWNPQIQRMDSDGSNLTDLLTYSNPGSGMGPVWSPDSRFIAFRSWYDSPGPNENIYRMDSDGNNLIPLVRPSPARDQNLRWSPDGRFIAFTSDRDSPEDRWAYTDIYIVDPDGNNLTRVTNHPNIDGDPTWSPDGRFIAFTSYRDDDFHVSGNIYKAEIQVGSGGEPVLDFPDYNLHLAIGRSLDKKGIVPSITSSEMTTLRTFNASNKDISDLTGLEHATNLTELNLTSNRIVDITLLTGLTKLTRLFLGGNNISDLAPLVANTGLGRGDEVDVRENALSTTSRNTHIPALRARGVNVRF